MKLVPNEQSKNNISLNWEKLHPSIDMKTNNNDDENNNNNNNDNFYCW